MASNPDAIHVRIFQQNDDNDVDCLDEYCANVSKKGEECPRVDQISVHKVHAKDAAGPLYARGMLSKDVEMAYVDGKLKPQVGSLCALLPFECLFLMLIRKNRPALLFF